MGIVEMAEEVGQQLPATKNLHESLSRAEELAARRKHTVVGIDHLLLALGQDPDALGEMLASRIDVKPLCADLLRKLGPEARVISPNAVPPGLDITVQNLLAHASATAREKGRAELDGAHLLQAVINGDGGFAAHRILSKHGLAEAGADTVAEAKPAPRPASDKPADEPARKQPQQPEAPAAAAKPETHRDPTPEAMAERAAPRQPQPQHGDAAGGDKDPDQTRPEERASNQAMPEAGPENITPRPGNDPIKEAIRQANQDLKSNEQGKRPDFGRRDIAPPNRGEAPPSRSIEAAQGQIPTPPREPAFGQRPAAPQPTEDRRAEVPRPPVGSTGEEYPAAKSHAPVGQSPKSPPWQGQPPQEAPRHQQSAQMPEKAEGAMPEDTSRDPATLASMAPERAAPPPPKKSERPLPPPNPQQPDRQMTERQPAFLRNAGQPQPMPEWQQKSPQQPPEPPARPLPPAAGETPQRMPPPPQAEQQEKSEHTGQQNGPHNGPQNTPQNPQHYPPHGQPPVMRPPVAGHARPEGEPLPDDPPPLRPRSPQQQPGQQPAYPQQDTAADQQAMQDIAANIRRNQASLEQHGIDDQVIENIPKVMRVDKLHYIEVRVARFTDAELEFDTEGYGLRAKTEKKPYTKAITVHLTGPDGQFLIDSAAAATQWCELHRASVDDADFAVWRWRVLPRKAGVSKLRLDVTVRATGENGLSAEIPVQPSKSFEVKVTRNYGRLFKRAFTILLLFGLGFAIARYGPIAYQTAQQEITNMLKDDDGS